MALLAEVSKPRLLSGRTTPPERLGIARIRERLKASKPSRALPGTNRGRNRPGCPSPGVSGGRHCLL
jgi:hypothetical protein